MKKRARKYFEWKDFNKRYYVPIHLLDTPLKKKIYLAKKANEFISNGDKRMKGLENLMNKYFV